MIEEQIKKDICRKAAELESSLTGFYGKIALNYTNGKFVVANVEQSIKESEQKK
jgi:hypothetical protein